MGSKLGFNNYVEKILSEKKPVRPKNPTSSDVRTLMSKLETTSKKANTFKNKITKLNSSKITKNITKKIPIKKKVKKVAYNFRKQVTPSAVNLLSA